MTSPVSNQVNGELWRVGADGVIVEAVGNVDTNLVDLGIKERVMQLNSSARVTIEG